MDRPVDGVTYREAQAILGRSRSWIGDRIRDGTLPRGPRFKRSTLSRHAVEQLALDLWTRRRHEVGGYWATADEVAQMLGFMADGSANWPSAAYSQQNAPATGGGFSAVSKSASSHALAVSRRS